MNVDFTRRFGFLVSDVARLYGQQFDCLAREEIGLSQPQCRVLGALAAHKGAQALSQTELAQRLGLSTMAVAGLCDRMSAAGWIRREPSRTDRRINRLHLEPRAMKALAGALAVGDALSQRTLAPLSADEREQLLALLAKARGAAHEPGRTGSRRRVSTALPPGGFPHRGMITISIMLATIMQALDTTIANVALPHMQGSLQASQDQITWVLTSYIVASAIALPLTGWLCARWGRRMVFIVSVIGFTVSSALCGLSTSLGGIVAARLLQGVFGAALVPLSQAVLLDINPLEKIGQAMAIWGAGIMVGPILGPMLGGWLTENFDWRWVFFINLPVGLFALWGIVRYLPESRPRSERLDIFGFVSLTIAIGMLQLFLDRGELLDWFDSWEIKLEAAASVIAFAFFAVHTATVQGVSFFDRDLLKDRNFVTGLLFAFIVGTILYGTMALLPTFLQNLMDYPVVYTRRSRLRHGAWAPCWR